MYWPWSRCNWLPPLGYQCIPPPSIHYISDHLALPSIVIWFIIRKRRLRRALYAAFVYVIAQPRRLARQNKCVAEIISEPRGLGDFWLVTCPGSHKPVDRSCGLLLFVSSPRCSVSLSARRAWWRHTPSTSSCWDSGLCHLTPCGGWVSRYNAVRVSGMSSQVMVVMFHIFPPKLLVPPGCSKNLRKLDAVKY